MISLISALLLFFTLVGCCDMPKSKPKGIYHQSNQPFHFRSHKGNSSIASSILFNSRTVFSRQNANSSNNTSRTDVASSSTSNIVQSTASFTHDIHRDNRNNDALIQISDLANPMNDDELQYFDEQNVHVGDTSSSIVQILSLPQYAEGYEFLDMQNVAKYYDALANSFELHKLLYHNCYVMPQFNQNTQKLFESRWIHVHFLEVSQTYVDDCINMTNYGKCEHTLIVKLVQNHQQHGIPYIVHDLTERDHPQYMDQQTGNDIRCHNVAKLRSSGLSMSCIHCVASPSSKLGIFVDRYFWIIQCLHRRIYQILCCQTFQKPQHNLWVWLPQQILWSPKRIL